MHKGTITSVRKKKILVVCGAGTVTSLLIVQKLRKALAKVPVKVEVIQCKVEEIPHPPVGIDLIITTVPVPSNLRVPVLSGMAFLTGVNEENLVKEVIKNIGE